LQSFGTLAETFSFTVWMVIAVLHSWTLSESYGEGHPLQQSYFSSKLPRVPQGGVSPRSARSATGACRTAFHCDKGCDLAPENGAK
jgi:hypothetical protein